MNKLLLAGAIVLYLVVTISEARDPLNVLNSLKSLVNKRQPTSYKRPQQRKYIVKCCGIKRCGADLMSVNSSEYGNRKNQQLPPTGGKDGENPNLKDKGLDAAAKNKHQKGSSSKKSTGTKNEQSADNNKEKSRVSASGAGKGASEDETGDDRESSGPNENSKSEGDEDSEAQEQGASISGKGAPHSVKGAPDSAKGTPNSTRGATTSSGKSKSTLASAVSQKNGIKETQGKQTTDADGNVDADSIQRKQPTDASMELSASTGAAQFATGSGTLDTSNRSLNGGANANLNSTKTDVNSAVSSSGADNNQNVVAKSDATLNKTASVGNSSFSTSKGSETSDTSKNISTSVLSQGKNQSFESNLANSSSGASSGSQNSSSAQTSSSSGAPNSNSTSANSTHSVDSESSTLEEVAPVENQEEQTEASTLSTSTTETTIDPETVTEVFLPVEEEMDESMIIDDENSTAECSSYNRSEQANAANQLARRDPNLPTKKPIVITGTVFPACGREYFVGNLLTTLQGAASKCFEKDMRLLEINTAKEFSCIEEIIPKAIVVGKLFWTSIFKTVSGNILNCESKTSFEEELMKDKYWADKKPLNFAYKRCLSFKFNSSVIDVTRGFLPELCHSAKQSKLMYICEPPCQNATCPGNCSSDVALFDEKGILKGAEKYGVWINACGKNYLFGNKLLNWDENMAMCCSLGMEPIVLESAFEQQCLSNLTSGKSWKYNFNYWTGGTQRDCRGQWRWCGSGPSEIKSEILWAPKQPDNFRGNEQCLHMRFYQGPMGVRIADRNCTNKYVYACQGSPNIGKLCKENIPNCPSGACSKDLTLFSGAYLKDKNSFGTWGSYCGRNYLFSNTKLSYYDAYKKCCSLGTTLLSVESSSKNLCLAKLTKNLPKTVGEYWTSGTNEECPGKYFWCSSDMLFNKEINWEAGHPKSEESCVYVKNTITVNTTLYGTDICTALRFFICEVRQLGTDGDTLSEECGLMHQAPDDEISYLADSKYNSSYIGDESTCFMKCLAENKKVFFANALLAVPTLRLIELGSKNNHEMMQSGFNTFGTCSSIRESNECLTASNMFGCAFDKNTALTNNIVTDLKGNSTVAALKSTLDSTGKTPIGKFVTLPTSKRKLFFSYVGRTLTKEFAYEYCCKIGMQLWRPATSTDVSEIRSAVTRLTPNGYAKIIVGGVKPGTLANTENWCESNTLLQKSAFSGSYPGYKCYETELLVSWAFFEATGLRSVKISSKNSFACQ